jgi:glycosyltransferase involved in cell wall biosynthesis
MIFLDVTGTCRSAKNTGMQRMTRQIFLELRKRTPVRPICWNTTGNRYHHLDRRELGILEAPFRYAGRAVARPDWRGEHFIAEFRRFVFCKGIRLEDELKSNDSLFVPDLYRDRRISRLPGLIAETRARSVAIFHDAASLRLRILSKEAQLRFQRYIDSLAAFDLVLCVSEEAQRDLHRFWKEHETKATETCVETWPIEFDEATRDQGAGSSRNMIICVATFEPRKNHLTLLRAAEKLWREHFDFELQLIGRSTGYYGPNVMRELKKLQKRGRPIRWLRHVSDETLFREYRQCRFTVYPSLMEGFGLPIIESLGHGKPCVCGGNGALGEVSRGGGCLIVDQTSEDALALGIRKLLSDQEAYIRLCTEARTRKFRSWPDYIERLLGHLQSPPKSVSIPAICGT